VLVTGGTAGANAEIYDPVTKSFAPTGNMLTARTGLTATRLGDGRVLIAGGMIFGGIRLSSAEIYDPSTGTFTPTENMHSARYGHAATLLADGKVLIAGGLLNTSGDHGIANAELYDPSTGTFTPISDMRFPQFAPTANLLLNGKVLVASGPDVDGTFRLVQIYDPDSETFTSTRDTAALYWHSATLFANGNVLLAGGGDSMLWRSLPGAALYDALTGNLQPTVNMTASRFLHTATLLRDGTVLIAGGECCVRGELSSAEIYDPVTQSFTAIEDMTTQRSAHTATLLQDGSVLIAGGYPRTSSAELFRSE